MSEDFFGIDLKIDPDTRDLVLDATGEPGLVKGRACLAQDLRHRILAGPEVLAFIQAGADPATLRDLVNLVELETERDPRVVADTAKAAVRQATHEGLILEVEFLPIGADTPDNLVVRLGGF